jgi:hypothetical protein
MIFCAFIGAWMVPDFAGPMKTLSNGVGELAFLAPVSMKALWLIARTNQAAAFHRKKSRPVTRKTI